MSPKTPSFFEKINFITKIASTKEERIALSNDGWSILEKDGDDWYFRKPK